ncbi:MAG: hypothetical protein IT267_12500 [Saprospiraceae bacterium]|nr:hypothetical protein [Saprospiraceae bacterium]
MSIWRLGQIKKEDIKSFNKEKKLAFDWMNKNINYKKEKDLKKFNGWTCINPWINEAKKDDIVFLVSKYNYAGVAVILDEYHYKTYDFEIKERELPGIPVKFIHLLAEPIEHNFNIRHTNPRTFCKINQFGFDIQEIMKFIKDNFPSEYRLVLDTINKLEPERFHRITRVCWNTNGWTEPSGRLGKATTDSHEKKYGFGHEEWLLNTSRVINGYQYGFLEPIRKFQKKYEGNIFNLLLFTRNSIEGINYWVGQLNEVEVLNVEQAKKALVVFKTRGVLENMRSQLSALSLDGNKLINEYLKERDIVNVRFKVSEIQNIFEEPIPVQSEDERISSLYYVLLPWNGDLNIEEIKENIGDYFLTGNKGKKKLKGKAKANYKSKSKEIDLTHNLISDAMMDYLIKKYGEDKVRRECRVIGNNRIDIVVRENNMDIFYEIKTYPHLITSLRYALGQLIEYSCFPNTRKAKQFYLVSNIKADQKFINYILHLNKLFGFNLGYICFDIESESIIQII